MCPEVWHGAMLALCFFVGGVLFSLVVRRAPISPLFPYTTLFRSACSSHVYQVTPTAERCATSSRRRPGVRRRRPRGRPTRSEEHTSELQSRFDLVCRLLLEKKKTDTHHPSLPHNNKPTPTSHLPS